MNNSPLLSVIIGSYNSSGALQNNLHVLIDFLKSKSFTWEILIVDDGSVEPERKSTEAIAINNNCIYLKNDVNLGKGAAIRKGMLQAKGEYRIFTDADIPYNPTAIDTIINYLEKKEYDIVVGDRTLEGGIYFKQVKKLRSLASRFFSWIVGAFIAAGMFDTQCGLKGFKAKVAEDIFSKSRINGFAFDVELFYIALKRNYEIRKVAVELRSQDGTSVSVLKHSIKMIFDLPLIIFNYYLGYYDRK